MVDFHTFPGRVPCVALSLRGLKRSAHVALIGDNRPHLYAAMCATHWLGAVAVPFYQDAVAEEMVSPFQRAEISHVFAENQEQVDKVLAALPHCPAIRCRAEARFDTGVGPDGDRVFVDLKVRDAKRAAPAQARRAA